MLGRVFDRLEDNPYADGVTKFYYTRMAPIGFTAYVDDDVRILYQLVSHDPPNWEHWNIEIHSIEFLPPPNA